jgi:hypothetical protein
MVVVFLHHCYEHCLCRYATKFRSVMELMELKEKLSSPLLKTPPVNAANKSSSTKKTLHDHVTGAIHVSEEHEKEMKDMMSQIIHSSKSNYRFKASTNGILVIVGTILIVSPIAFTWLKSIGMIPAMSDDVDLTNLNYFLGGIGIVAFVTTFFNKPQRQMTVAIADLAQLGIICQMYLLQYHTIAGKLSEESNDEKGTFCKDVVDNTSKELCNDRSKELYNDTKELYDITKNAADLIDKHIERHARSEEGAQKGKN